jgi:hypothetical protein
MRLVVDGPDDLWHDDREIVNRKVGFQVQQRLDLEPGRLRFLGGIGDFQNELTAVRVAQAKILIALADQGLEFALKTVVLPNDLKDLALAELWRFALNYCKRVCLCHRHSLPIWKMPQYGAPLSAHQDMIFATIQASKMADPARSVYNPGGSPFGPRT